MKFFTSIWFYLLLAIVVFLISVAVIVSIEYPKLMQQIQEAERESLEQVPPSEHWEFIPWNPYSDDIERVLTELSDRLSTVMERELQLEEWENQLRLERIELEALKEQVVEVQNAISRRLVAVERQEIANLRSLARRYQEMQPAAAIEILRSLEDDEVVKILYYMDNETSSGLLAQMVAAGEEDRALVQRAARLTQRLLTFTTPDR